MILRSQKAQDSLGSPFNCMRLLYETPEGSWGDLSWMSVLYLFPSGAVLLIQLHASALEGSDYLRIRIAAYSHHYDILLLCDGIA